MKSLGNFEIDQYGTFNLNENIFTGSAFLPALGQASTHYTLKGNFKCDMLYNTTPTPKGYTPARYGGDCDFTFSPIVYMPETVLNASLIYLFYQGMKLFNGDEVDGKGFSQPKLTATPVSLTNNFAPLLFEGDLVEIIDRSGVLPPTKSGIKLEGINLKSPKLFCVMQDGELRAPNAINIVSIGSSAITYNPDNSFNFLDAITGQNIEVAPYGELGVGILRDVLISCQVEKWDAVVGYITTMEYMSVDLIFSTLFMFDTFEHTLNFSELNNDLNIDLFSIGNQGDTPNALNVINYLDSKTIKGVFYFAENGSGVNYSIEAGVIKSKTYVGLISPLNYQRNAGNTLGIFNFCSGVDIGDQNHLIITKQNLEAIEPNTTGENQERIILEDNLLDDFPLLACFSDGAYTVILGGAENNKSFAYFCLRDGGGYYPLDLSEIVPVGGWVEYGSYLNGVLTIGYYPSIDDYPDPDVDPPPLLYAMITTIPIAAPVQRVVLDFRKLNLSFLPCTTTCMAKGGITSKVY